MRTETKIEGGFGSPLTPSISQSMAKYIYRLPRIAFIFNVFDFLFDFLCPTLTHSV